MSHPSPSSPAARAVLGRSRRLGVLALCTVLLTVGGMYGPGGASAEHIDVFGGIDPAERPADGEGLNILLAGSDTREGLSKAERQRLHVGGDGCDCTDVLMLVHLSADRERVSVVSIPRDSYLPFAPHREPDRPDDGLVRHAGKVNAAHKHGGPALTVRTVERVTGVRIHHYAELDFAGFVQAVDDIGGAPVCTKRALRDRFTGLDLAAGPHRLDGLDGLRYVRSRKVGSGVPGDMGRMRRQQHFVGQLLSTLARTGSLSSPLRLHQLASALHDSARMDRGLTDARLLRLGRSLSGVRLADMEFSMVPMDDFDHRVDGWGSTLLWNEEGAKELFAKLRADQPITTPRTGPPAVALDPRTIAVRVHDGTRQPGTGERAASALREQGFDAGRAPQTGATEAGYAAGRTRIRYGPGRDRQAETLAAALPGGARLERDDAAGGFATKPVSPSRTTSRLPPKAVATTGFACSIASRFTSPNVSKQIDGVTKTSVAA